MLAKCSLVNHNGYQYERYTYRWKDFRIKKKKKNQTNKQANKQTKTKTI